MPGVNFDRAASFYDATRGLPDGVPEDVRDAVLRHVGAGPDTRFLEIGIGTGRIALPFLGAGYAYHGIDLSSSMLRTLRDKLDAIRGPCARGGLAVADSMDLPFRAAAFDVVLMIHVIHLVDDHRRALSEARRVLRSGGRLIVSANEFAAGNRRDEAAGRLPPARRLVANRWNAILAELGADRARGGSREWLLDEAMAAALEELGTSVERVVLARYRERPRTAREAVIAHRDRVFSSDWDIPDDVHAEASRRLLRWLEHEHPASDEPSSEEAAFAVLVGTVR
jgi:SAM-dependent methyltransferase